MKQNDPILAMSPNIFHMFSNRTWTHIQWPTFNYCYIFAECNKNGVNLLLIFPVALSEEPREYLRCELMCMKDLRIELLCLNIFDINCCIMNILGVNYRELLWIPSKWTAVYEYLRGELLYTYIFEANCYVWISYRWTVVCEYLKGKLVNKGKYFIY